MKLQGIVLNSPQVLFTILILSKQDPLELLWKKSGSSSGSLSLFPPNSRDTLKFEGYNFNFLPVWNLHNVKKSLNL